jgi:hypothetical protein
MAGELLTSTGGAGIIEQRSAGRTYFTSDAKATRADKLLRKMELVHNSMERHNSRREVFRANCTPEVISELESHGKIPSVKIPLSELGRGNDILATFEHNTHESDVPEWDAIYADWKHKKEIPNPVDQIDRLPNGYSLTNDLKSTDAETLYELWKPFGWTRQKIKGFLNTYKDKNNLWVSAVRDNNGRLASACMGEALVFDGIYMVEATEFGTRVDERRKNLSAVAVIGLNAQIIQRALYEEDHVPLIISEYNMDPSSRSDKVGRKTGMTIPGVDGVEGLTDPIQVLRKNVAVLDGGVPNNLLFGQMPDEYRKKYREAYKDTHRYWRNFIVGMMTKENMDKYYSPDQTEQILARFINH